MIAQRWKKRAKHTIFALLLACFCLSTSIYMLLNFESGNRLALQATQFFLPELTVSESQGTLWQGLYIEQLSYQNQAVKVEFEQLSIQLRATDIFYGKVAANRLHANALKIKLLSSDEPEKAATEAILPQLITPLPISIKQLTLGQFLLLDDQQELLTLQEIYVQASWFHHRLSLSELSLQHPIYQSKLTAAKAQLNFTEQWPIQGQLSIHTQAISELAPYFHSPQFTADFTVSGNLHQLQLQAITQQPFASQHHIQIKPFTNLLALSSQSSWQSIPLQLEEQVPTIKQGQLAIHGDLTAINVTLSSQLEWQDQVMQLDISASGNSEHITLSQAQLSQETQSLQLQGAIQTQPLAWQLSGKARALDIATIIDTVDSRLNFDLATHGSYQDNQLWQADLALNNLKGELQSQTIEGFIRLGRDPQRWWSDSDLALKRHSLALQGELKKDYLDIKLKGHSQSLQAIYPESAGQLEFDVSIQGDYTFPRLTGFIKANKLAWQQWQLHATHLQLEYLQEQQLKLTLHQLQHKQQQWLEQLTLKAAGNKQELQWQLTLQNSDSNLHSQWQTLQQANHWQLLLQQLAINDPWLGNWHLQAGKAWQLAAKQQSIPEFCLIQTEQSGMLCLQAQHEKNNAQAQINLQQFNLAHLAPLLDESAQLNAALNSSLSLSYQEKQLSSKLQADINHGYLQFSEDEQELVRIPWQTIALQASLNQQRYHLQLDAALDPNNYLRQSLQGHITDQQALQGRLQFQFNELRIAELFAPVRQVKGLIHGDFRLTGMLVDPKLQGEIKLKETSMQVPDAGLVLENMQLSIRTLANGHVSIDGQLLSDNKPLYITGQAQQQSKLPWPMDLHIHGQQVQLLNLSNMQLWADPDLHISLRENRLINRGDIHVHKAHITLKDLPKNAISPSSDSVIVGAEEQNKRWLVDTDLQIFLGKDFFVEGMGLKSYFNGDVRIIDQANKPLSLDGIVRIIDGRYKAYGQNLNIERGNLLFQGAPDNPGLDIIATRTLSKHNVKAGLEFSGTLKNPRSRVFSEPAMDESDAMSWLLFGKPLAGTSESDGSALVQAIAVYGLEQGESVTHKLSDKLGWDVGFDTDGEDDEAAFTLGKQLSSRLYLRYSVALFENLSSIMLRYKISDSINLETRSTGQSNSIDLLYRKERD